MPSTGESVTAADGEVSRSSGAEQRLRELAIQLPLPPAPIGIYAETVQTMRRLSTSGWPPIRPRHRTVVTATIIVLDAGHFALDTKPDEIAGLVRSFMTAQE
jgi:hypothetical protein